MKDFDFTCVGCGAIVFSDEVCLHENCYKCQVDCCMGNDEILWAEFAVEMQRIRAEYPKYAKEIDRCIYSVGQTLKQCADPNCTCKINFETFHRISNEQSETRI